MYTVFYALNKTRIEKLTKSSFKSFLNILVKFWGSFLQQIDELVSLYILKILKRENLSQKYVFESIDISFLKKIPLDSDYLIEYYRLEDNN